MQLGTLAEWFVGLAVFFAAGVALWIAANANKAKLKGECIKYPGWPLEYVLDVKNTGQKDLIIHRIVLCVGKGKYQRCRHLWSHIEVGVAASRGPGNPLRDFSTTGTVPGIARGSGIKLEIGKSCSLYIPQIFKGNPAPANLKKLVRSLQDAKTLRFMVETDYGYFPVKSEKPIIADIVETALKDK